MSPKYETYTFPYAIYAITDEGEDASEVYSKGFLPYSANPNEESILYYKARSLRINLARFTDSSENRRVSKKYDNPPVPALVPTKEFDGDSSEFLQFCHRYIKERFPQGAMPPERLTYILSHPLTTHFLDYTDKNGKRIGTVVASIHREVFHYWFCFFDHTAMLDFPLGKWIMWRSIQFAKDMDIPYIYLGTCYGTKSLYKARDFRGVEWHDGRIWNTDIKKLKAYCKEDYLSSDIDRYKTK